MAWFRRRVRKVKFEPPLLSFTYRPSKRNIRLDPKPCDGAAPRYVPGPLPKRNIAIHCPECGTNITRPIPNDATDHWCRKCGPSWVRRS